MTLILAELLKDTDYKLTQFKPDQIKALEDSITMKETGKHPAPTIGHVTDMIEPCTNTAPPMRRKQ